ncbi:hypothetical protein ACFL3S_02705 [Gemmatimonadota bacterium]
MVRDSAGVTVVENSDPRWKEGEGWRVSADPVLDIGVMDGDSVYQFFRVAGALITPEGGIAVANSGTGEIRFFDSDGGFVRATGRKGGGPGEFEDLLWILRSRGDSLLAYDWRYRRVSVLSPQGDFVRSFELDLLTTTGGFPVLSETFADGHLLLATEMTFASGEISEGAKRDSAVYYLLDSDGVVLDTLGAFPGGESYNRMEGDTWFGGGLVFGRFGQAAVSGDGFYYGSSDEYEIGYFDRQGRLQRVIRVPHENFQVTQEDIDRYVTRSLETARNEERRQVRRTLFETMPFPDEMPAYSELEVDAEGHLWVAEYRRPGDDQPRWRVFDPEGALLGTVKTPIRFRIFEIGPDYILGRWDDEQDVEHIRVYRLLKG